MGINCVIILAPIVGLSNLYAGGTPYMLYVGIVYVLMSLPDTCAFSFFMRAEVLYFGHFLGDPREP